MPEDIQLTSRDKFSGEFRKQEDGELPPLHLNFNPGTASLKRKLVISLAIETLISLVIYYNYEKLVLVNDLLAPGLLGASTAALAQSMNQYFKFKFSLNKIYKFIIWGVINGVLTVLWIDMLRFQFESLFYRIFFDQLIGAPVFQMIYNILSALWDTGELSNILLPSHLRSLKYSYCFWPIFSTCAFIFLPPSAFFPANCLANLVWNIILSKLG